jgi:hypothetical protein
MAKTRASAGHFQIVFVLVLVLDFSSHQSGLTPPPLRPHSHPPCQPGSAFIRFHLIPARRVRFRRDKLMQLVAWRPVHRSPATRDDGGSVHHSSVLRADGGSFPLPPFLTFDVGSRFAGLNVRCFPACFRLPPSLFKCPRRGVHTEFLKKKGVDVGLFRHAVFQRGTHAVAGGGRGAQ